MPDVPTSKPEQAYQGAPSLMVPDVSATETLEYSVVWRDNAAVHLAKGEHAPTGVRIFFWIKDVDAFYAEVVSRGATRLWAGLGLTRSMVREPTQGTWRRAA